MGEVVYQTISEQLDSFMEACNETAKPITVFTFDNKDVIANAAQSMLKSIVYSQDTDEKEKKVFATKMSDAQNLLVEREKLEVPRIKAAAKAAELALQEMSVRDAFRLEESVVDADLRQAEREAARRGQGCWCTRGTPSSPRSEELLDKYKNDIKHIGVTMYESNGFKVWHDPNLTEDQVALRKIVQTQAERKKELSLKAEAQLCKITTEKNQAEAEALRLDKLSRAVAERHDTATKQLERELENLLPTHQIANAQLLQQASAAIKSSAETFNPCVDDLSSLKVALVRVKAGLDGRGKIPIHTTIQQIQLLWDCVKEKRSRLALLENLGIALITELITPKIQVQADELQSFLNEASFLNLKSAQRVSIDATNDAESGQKALIDGTNRDSGD